LGWLHSCWSIDRLYFICTNLINLSLSHVQLLSSHLIDGEKFLLLLLLLVNSGLLGGGRSLSLFADEGLLVELLFLFCELDSLILGVTVCDSLFLVGVELNLLLLNLFRSQLLRCELFLLDLLRGSLAWLL